MKALKPRSSHSWQRKVFVLSFMETIVTKFECGTIEPNALIWKVPKVISVLRCYQLDS